MHQAAWADRQKGLEEENEALSKKLRLQADLSHKADAAAQAKVSQSGWGYIFLYGIGQVNGPRCLGA